MSRMQSLALLSCFFLLTVALDGRAAMAEFDECGRVPQEVRFVREIGNGPNVPAVFRYERYPGEDWIRRDYKNPERVTLNGPLHGRNCAAEVAGQVAPPGSVHRVSFRFRTANYFQSGIASHLAVLLRASLARVEGVTGGTQSGRGLAIFPSAIYAENFSYGLGPGVSVALVDEVWYAVDIVATQYELAVLVVDPAGQVLQWTWTDTAPVDMNGHAFAVLCDYSENSSCEYAEGSAFARLPFEVHFADISVRLSVDGEGAPSARQGKRSPRVGPVLGAVR